MEHLVDRPRVLDARERVSRFASVTPVVDAPALGGVAGVAVSLKLENQQVTGSFKVRGAANVLQSLSADQQRAGVVAVSSGNHGRAVAHVGKALKIPVTVCLSERVPEAKRAAIASLGATVVVAGPDQDAADAEARRLTADQGLTFIHPFDDPLVIAGQGTVGLEVAEQAPQAASVIVPMSGGGLIAGIGVALDGSATLIGVSQDRGPAMHHSLAAGRLVDVVEEDTLADALAGGLGPENRFTLSLCQRLVTDTAVVSEDEIADAMRFLHAEHGIRVEGGGAVGVAALLASRLHVAGPAVVIVSGGNVSDEAFQRIIAG